MRTCGGGGTRETGKAGSGQVEMGGALLSGGLRSFGLLHCGIRSRRHCGARMAAPGTAIVENERDGQHWGRHLPHGVTLTDQRRKPGSTRIPLTRNLDVGH